MSNPDTIDEYRIVKIDILGDNPLTSPKPMDSKEELLSSGRITPDLSK